MDKQPLRDRLLKIETPSTRNRVFSKTETFSPNTATVHTRPAFSGTENGGFHIRSPRSVEIFKIGDSSYSC